MRLREFIYNSETATDAAEQVRDRLREREGAVEVLDLETADSEADARRAAMLSVGDATGIGSKPDAVFDDEGHPDFAPGVLILDRDTGERELHVGADALDALDTLDRQ